MASYRAELPRDLISQFQNLEANSPEMLGEMVKAGANVALSNIKAKMPQTLREGLTDNNIGLTRVYRTPSDDGINCEAMIFGYFKNRNGVETPAPLVANMFEYGSSKRNYPRQPFFRSSFNKSQITAAMLRVQEKYIKEN